jgi:hypothetical protein
MKKSRIAINLRPTDYSDVVDLGNRVVAALTGNGNFTTPAVSLVNLQAAITDVVNALSLWNPTGNYASKAALEDLQNKSLTLWQLLRAEADYVQTASQLLAGSDYSTLRAIMTTSGYNLKSDGSPQGLLESVQNFHHFITRTLAPNKIKLKWERPLNVTSAGNVKSYRVFRGTTNVFSAAVEIDTTSKTSYIDTNATGAVQSYYYWIVAVGAAGDGAPSDVVFVMIVSN